MEFSTIKSVTELLEVNSDPTKVLLIQDGVIIKGSLADDSKNFKGCLLIVQKRAKISDTGDKTNNKDNLAESFSSPLSIVSLGEFFEENKLDGENDRKQSGEEYFLIWTPYTFLVAKFPKLLPLTLSHLLEEDNQIFDMKEWMFIMCLSIRKISKVQRRANLRGTRIITLSLLDGTTASPLIFLYGGITKFLDTIKKIAPLRQSSIEVDDFIIYGKEDTPTSVNGKLSSKNGIKNSNTSSSSNNNNNNNNNNKEKTSSIESSQNSSYNYSVRHDDFRRVLYNNDNSNATSGARLRASLATTFDGVRSLILRGLHDSRARQQLQLNSSNHNETKTNTETIESETEAAAIEESFELLAELIPVEQQIPRIPAPPNNRSMSDPLTLNIWNDCFVGPERILDPHRFARARSIAFVGGIAKEIRLQAWCFMLRAYSDEQELTETQRDDIRQGYAQMYERLSAQWRSIFPEQESQFSAFREVRSAIEKDVIRTDRAHEAYADSEGAKQTMLRNILMAYAMFNFDLGYCQGMSDILSPIVLLTNDEVEAFMCFRCFLAEHCEGNFRHDVKEGMKKRLSALSTLIRVFVPQLYDHLHKRNADDMSFCFRWILMLFKREFSIDDTMLLWDVIISCPYTPNFELFIAAALLKALSQQILEQHFTYDELLKFSNSISCKLDVKHVILLAQDFYDEVATKITELTVYKSSKRNYRPTLDEILKILHDFEA